MLPTDAPPSPQRLRKVTPIEWLGHLPAGWRASLKCMLVEVRRMSRRLQPVGVVHCYSCRRHCRKLHAIASVHFGKPDPAKIDFRGQVECPEV